MNKKVSKAKKIRKKIIFPPVLIGTIAYTHCYFTRLDLKKMAPLQICFSIFSGIHRNSKWKEFFYSCEGFLMATITGHGHPIPLWKYAWSLEFFGTKCLHLKCLPFSDFIQNLSQAPSKRLSKWIKVDKWDFFKNPS